MRLSRKPEKLGTLPRHMSPIKDAIDFQLTRFPSLYLIVDRSREWVNWDKRIYLSFVRPGDTVLDVGANVGAHAVFLSHMVRASGRVLAFEPLPRNIDSLNETIRRRARFANISVFPLAVGNPESVRQTVMMKVPGDDLTQASLAIQTAGSWGSQADISEIACTITSIDLEEELQRLRRLDFLKLDVEGAELDALRGAARTIVRHHPLIYCEVYEEWAASFGYSPADLLEFVRSLGYASARVISNGKVHALPLGRNPPRGMFETSSDVLFFADKHLPLVNAFDRRYLD